jgi:serine/threonine protein kinase
LETGPLDAAEGAHVGVEICRALDYAHRRGGIVHRDVTPRNVLLDEEGAIRLIDFGIAAPVSGTGATERIEVFGSPGHMPPEQIRGERLTSATDVFAVGALLIEAWTGRPPFRRGSFEASADALKEPLTPLDHERPDLEPVASIIAQAVALSAAERPQDAEILARKLRDFSRQFDSGDVAKRIGERVRRARRRLRTSLPWVPGESSGPLTPAASPRALLSSRPPRAASDTPRTPATPSMSVTPSGAVPITRTFAARDDLVEWTRKMASAPPPPHGHDDSDPDPETDHTPPPSVPHPSPAPQADADADADEPATRPLPPSQAPGTPRRRIPTLALGIGLALLAALAAANWRSDPGPGAPVLQPAAALRERPAPPPEPAAAAVSAAPAPVTAPASAHLPSSTRPPVSSSASPARSAAALVAATNPSAEPTSTLASASLKLTADPPATVIITGAKLSETHVTPVRALKLPPGSYSVTFRSPTFGEPVVARVELSANASRSIHADFRAAIPTVAVR